MRPSPRHEGASRPSDRGGAARDEAPRNGRHRRPRSQRGRGAGVLTERSAAERASTRRPEESLSAGEPRTCEDPRAIGAPAPQRPSRGHRRGEPPRRLRRPWIEPGFKDPTPKRSEAERGVGSEPATGAETASATDVTWLIYTHIFHYPHNTSAPGSPPPLTPSGGGDLGRECVWARAGAHDGKFRSVLQAQNGDFVHGIGL